MRRSLFMLCAISGGFLQTVAFAQFGSGGGGFGSGSTPSKPPVIADEDLRPIQLEIAILDVPAAEAGQPALKDEQQIARLERLEADGKLAGLQRLRVTLIANQPSQFQLGETVQITVGRTRPPGDPAARGGFAGQFSEATRAQNIGTLLMATARPVTGGALVDLKLERSGLNAPKPAEGADAALSEAPRTRQLTVNSTVLLPEGETKIISSSLHSRGDGAREETWVLARVAVGPVNKPQGVSMISIFHLKNTRAKDAADMITSVFDHGNVRAIADARTNTALVVSAAENEMKQIEAILQKLDENVAAPVVPKVELREFVPDNSEPFFEPRKPQIRKTPDDALTPPVFPNPKGK